MVKYLVTLSMMFMISLTPTSCSKKVQEPTMEERPQIIHKAHLQDGWYEKTPIDLNKTLDAFFTQANKNFSIPSVLPENVKALIVPHAGHFYSGLCSASTYQTLLEKVNQSENSHKNHKPQEFVKNNHIKRVIILAPSHSIAFHGLALPDYTDYQTPLGLIHVDNQAISILSTSRKFQVNAQAHASEHSLEVQLPFLQKTINEFEIIPLIVGDIKEFDYLEICEKLDKIIDDKTLIVISSDFVHHGKDYEYNPFDKNILDSVRQLDSIALQRIFDQSLEKFTKFLRETDATICGREPIKIFLAMIGMNKISNVDAHLCCYYTSAHMELARDAQNNKIKIEKLFQSVPDDQAARSVSYAGIAFSTKQKNTIEPCNRLTGYEKKALLACARSTLETVVKSHDQQKNEALLYPILSPGLMLQSGAFVTLNTKDENLRGCIGRITTNEHLYQTVMRMTFSAALHDNRFSPVQENEIRNLIIDISILTPPSNVKSEKDIVIGKHGVILNKHNEKGEITNSSVFLPQVPVSYRWNVTTTLEQLSLKAGLDRNSWKENCSFEVFEGYEIKEEPL